MEQKPILKSKREGFIGKWLRFLYADYQNGLQTISNYEYVERTTRKGDCDGVIIAGIITYPIRKAKNQIVIIANYRVTADNYVLEFPAGLIDEKDREIDEATRELNEETGFEPEKIIKIIDISSIPQISNITYAEPSVTNENEKFVILEINGDKEENMNRNQKLEEAENIIVYTIDLDENFLKNLIKLAETKGYEIESKLYTFALGYMFGSLKI